MSEAELKKLEQLRKLKKEGKTKKPKAAAPQEEEIP